MLQKLHLGHIYFLSELLYETSPIVNLILDHLWFKSPLVYNLKQ